MYLIFNVFYFYSGVGQKDSGVGRAHLPPPLCYALDVDADKSVLILFYQRNVILVDVLTTYFCLQTFIAASSHDQRANSIRHQHNKAITDDHHFLKSL
jgi:hypothetical protein